VGLLADLFGAKDVIQGGFDLIDDCYTSEEERIRAGSEAKVSLLQAYHPFRKAQRALALLFAVNFVVCFWLVMYFALSYVPPDPVFNDAGIVVNTNTSAPADVARGVIAEFYMGEIMLSIIVFYFGGGFAEGIIGRLKDGRKQDGQQDP
jgi:hypothetical protein